MCIRDVGVYTWYGCVYVHVFSVFSMVGLFFSCQPAPFFVLDEIDAALDNTNINRVSQLGKSSWKRVLPKQANAPMPLL